MKGLTQSYSKPEASSRFVPSHAALPLFLVYRLAEGPADLRAPQIPVAILGFSGAQSTETSVASSPSDCCGLFSAPRRGRVQKHVLATEVSGNKVWKQRWRKMKDVVAFLCQLESRHECEED